MLKILGTTSAILAALALGACTVHQSDTATLAGPSQLALSLTVAALPDSIAQDGGAQSKITIAVIGQCPGSTPGVPVHLDMIVGGVVQDYGTLSTRNVVTGNDGTASAIYTAPPPPPPASGGVTTTVTIRATPSCSNAATVLASQSTATIRLVPPGVILPPAGTPTAAFIISPTTVNINTVTRFDASTSLPGSGATSIVSYAWAFGDGGSASGLTSSHTYTNTGNVNVTLTVTNDRGVSASTTQALTVAATTAPTANFVVSQTAPVVGQTVFFNGQGSRAAAGHSIVTWAWDFGDGNFASDALNTSHSYSLQGTYTPVLTVTDDTGQQGTFSVSLIVGSGNPVAAFTVSPGTPIHGFVANFDGSNSLAFGGATIVDYQWNFGDATATIDAGATSSQSHTFSVSSTSFGATNGYPVTLTVVDSKGRRASITIAIVVQ